MEFTKGALEAETVATAIAGRRRVAGGNAIGGVEGLLDIADEMEHITQGRGLIGQGRIWVLEYGNILVKGRNNIGHAGGSVVGRRRSEEHTFELQSPMYL